MRDPAPAPPKRWLTPEELVTIGFERSRVVMMNEAHHLLLRCVRTREVGRSILPAAHRAGVRHLAMEALFPQFAAAANDTRALPEMEGAYVSQPELRTLIEAALALGWTLIPYDVNTAPPLGLCFAQISGIEPFAIDQIRSVEFPGHVPDAAPWVGAYADVFARLGGAAGFLAEDAPDGWRGRELADAFLIATDNRMS